MRSSTANSRASGPQLAQDLTPVQLQLANRLKAEANLRQGTERVAWPQKERRLGERRRNWCEIRKLQPLKKMGT